MAYVNVKDYTGVPFALVGIKGFYGLYNSLKNCMGILCAVFLGIF